MKPNQHNTKQPITFNLLENIYFTYIHLFKNLWNSACHTLQGYLFFRALRFGGVCGIRTLDAQNSFAYHPIKMYNIANLFKN